MLSQPCQYAECPQVTVPGGGICFGCRQNLCKEHWYSVGHACKQEGWDPREELRAQDEEDTRIQARIDNLDIVNVAISLRPGHTASTPTLNVKDLPRGMYNIHVPIHFDDGVQWMARIRQNGLFALPASIERNFVKGEIDTMRWLSQCDAAPVPRVLSPLMTKGDTIFYFTEFVQGSPGTNPLWAGDKPRSEVSQIIRNYAEINVRRAQHPLPLVGSIHLDESANTFTVGPMFTCTIPTGPTPILPGPWRTSAEKYQTLFDIHLDDIRAGSLLPKDSRRAFLVYSWMKEAVMAYPPYNVEGENYVVHEDSNGGHLMIEGGRVVGMMDWEYASVGPMAEAFATPQCFEDELFKSGSNELSWAELELAEAYRHLGRPDLAENIKLGRPYQWMSILLDGSGHWCNYTYIKALGESLGLEMKDTLKEFLVQQRKKFKKEYKVLERQWDAASVQGQVDSVQLDSA